MSCLKCCSHCSTHNASSNSLKYAILHSIHVLTYLLVVLYIFIALSIQLHLPSNTLHPDPSCSSSSLPYYQPVPCSAICKSFDQLPYIFLTNNSLVQEGFKCFTLHDHGRTSSRRYLSRHAHFLFTLLLVLAGDINLNPGPAPLPTLNFSHLNIRSAASVTADINKPAVLQDFVISHKIDVLALSETWLSPDSTQFILNSLTPPAYSLIHLPRPLGTGGGLAFIYKSVFDVSRVCLPMFPSFEALCIRLSFASTSFIILDIYRPPSSSKVNFISDFSTLLEDLISSPSELLITGDFNFHLDLPVPPSDTHFLNLLDTFSLTQHVTFPTHHSTHTLDLLITRSSSNFISSVTFTDPGVSDHLAILSTISVSPHIRPPRVTKTVRSFRSINIKALSQDIESSCLNSSPAVNLDSYLSQFNSMLSSLLDKHAPLKSVSYTDRTQKPFITKDILLEKSKRSKLETLYRRTRLPTDLLNFKTQSRLVAKLITSSRRAYFKTLISNSTNKPKKLWSVINSLLSRSTPNILPTAASPSSLASSFLNYFSDKISKLSASFPPTAAMPSHSAPPTPPPCLSSFTPASTDEVRTAILHSSDATCALDIFPTFLLKSCLDALIKPITTIINLALSEGTFPTKFKHALVHPKLKNPSLPHDDLSSYRPISNLNFISKILERIIYTRLNNHLQSFSALSPCQSAYRKFHSTETALLRISNDLLTACNEQKVSALILLDLSAAFDTIDHQILLSRLSTTFGITGNAHSLLSSYLLNRTQSVVIGSNSSLSQTLSTGVPQGSVLGPLLFCLYTTPLSSSLSDAPVSSHFYADDSQLYISFSSTDSTNSLAALSRALDSTYDWLTSNRLSVNPSKTEYLLVGTPQQRSKVLSSSLSFRGNDLTPSSHVRNLGITFDSNLSFTNHITNVCRSSFHQIRQLRQVRSSLDRNSTIILANALVSSKLDYCNSLLYSLPTSTIKRLQRVQNSLARVVEPTIRYSDHITPTLRRLHWLPIQQRITFKIATLTFKTLQHKQPAYLSDLLHPYTPSRNLRSCNQNLLSVPYVKSAIGRRSFFYAAPTIWNSLPPALRASSSLQYFLSGLKTHLFPP
jgi:hypothetical protein